MIDVEKVLKRLQRESNPLSEPPKFYQKLCREAAAAIEQLQAMYEFELKTQTEQAKKLQQFMSAHRAKTALQKRVAELEIRQDILWKHIPRAGLHEAAKELRAAGVSPESYIKALLQKGGD